MKHWLAAIAILAAAGAAADLVDHRLTLHSLIGSASSEPAQIRPELDNASMLVLRIRMAPHEKTGMHDVSARLVIWLTGAHLRDTAEDGTTTDYRRTPGTVEWVSTRRHAGENLSDQPIEFLAVVPKSTQAAPHAGEHRERH